MLRVRRLLSMPELRLSERVGGDLLEREVRQVFSTELPDPSRYLSGGELVLSGLLWWHGPGDGEEFVRALADADVAALGASPADLGEIPAELVESCRRHRVALLAVPPDLSFAVITEQVVLALAANRAGTSLDQRRRLLTTVAEGSGLTELLRSGSEELGAPCWVRTATGRVVAGTPDGASHTEVPVPARSARAVLPWALVTGALRPGQHPVADELAGLVALERARDDHDRAVEDRAAKPLLRLLSGGSPGAAELAAPCLAAGFAPDEPVRVLAASADDPELAAALLTALLAELGCRGPVGVVEQYAYALPVAATWPDDASTTAEEVLRVVELGSVRVAIGVSAAASPAGLPGAAEEARYAARLGERRDDAVSLVFGAEIAAHRLLLAGAPDALRHALRSRLLGALIDYDRAHGTDLLGTLRVYLRCSGSPTAAAERLHVHVNTLRYRIGRVEELLEVDLGDFANRVDLYLALQADR